MLLHFQLILAFIAVNWREQLQTDGRCVFRGRVAGVNMGPLMPRYKPVISHWWMTMFSILVICFLSLWCYADEGTETP